MGIIVTADCFIEGLRRADLGRCDFREELMEDITLTCSRLIGSRSFDFVVNCKHCITVFDGCLSLAPVLGLADDWRNVVVVFGEDLALLEGWLGDETENLALSTSVVVEPVDMANVSSEVDSPAAGIATSAAPEVTVVSALDQDVSVFADVPQPVSCRQSLRLRTCGRVCC